MSYYDIDFTKLVKLLLPVRLRQQKMIHWLQCLVQPVKDLYDRFTVNRNNNIYTLAHNSQVVKLQQVLNDVFDTTDRGIYVVDTFIADPLYVFLEAESHPLWLGWSWEAPAPGYTIPSWLYTDAEIAFVAYHFIIKVPTGVTVDMARLNALVDKYRLPSRNRYTVVYY